MKKLLILLTIMSFCASFVSALQISDVALGSSTASRGSTVNGVFTITNNEASTLTGISVVSSAASKYLITFSNIPSSLASGSSASVSVSGFIPFDFDGGKIDIGTITVSGRIGSGSPQSQNPSTVPLVLSASNDCGSNSPDVISPIIGMFHVGKNCDNIADINVGASTIDKGWLRVHSDSTNAFWVKPVQGDCASDSVEVPPSGFLFGGKIHTGPAKCDGWVEGVGLDSGWVGFYSNPQASGQVILVVSKDNCGSLSQTVPENGIVLGEVSTGPAICDGMPEAVAYNNAVLDSGSVKIVYVPNLVSTSNHLPVGTFDGVSWSGLYGWAFDSDAPSISVHVYVDGSFWKSLDANILRQDLVDAGVSPDGFNGFSYQFTQADLEFLNTSKNHEFMVYAINSPQGDNPLLNGNPKTLSALVNSTNSTNGTNNSNSNNSVSVVSATAKLSMESKQDLVIDRVKVNCDKLVSVSEGSSVDKVSPGVDCEVTVRVKNSGSVTMKNVDVDVDSPSNDITGDSDTISSLSKSDTEEVSVVISVDEDVDDGKIEVIINVEGSDSSNSKYSDVFSFFLNVERLKHDLPVSRIVVSPTEIKTCDTSQILVKAYIENNGKRDEDSVGVELSVPGLNFVKKVTDLSIDRDDEETVSFSIPLTKNSPFGSFVGTVKSYFDNVALSNSKNVDIVVTKCSDAVTTVESVVKPVVKAPVKNDLVVVPPASSEDNNFKLSDSALYTGILTFANLVGLTVLGVMSYGYFKNRPPKVSGEVKKSSYNNFY